MIDLTKVTSSVVNLQKAPAPNDKVVQKAVAQIEGTTNLNLSPTSYFLPSTVLQKAKGALDEFQQEFGEVKSATYVCEQIKQARAKGDTALVDELQELRNQYSPKVKRLRKEVSGTRKTDFEGYISALRKYLKENGSYMNCQECSDLMCDSLRKKGVRADNILLYTVNNDGVRTSKAEHVFTLAGLDKNAIVSDPSTWGNCYIVDGWSGICMPYQKGIEFFKEFFQIDPSKHKLAFDFA